MNWETWFTFIVVITVLTVLVLDLLPPSAAMGSGMVAVLVTGVVTPAEALSGFSNPAPVTVAALYVLARAVEKTGALGPLVRFALGDGTNRRKSLARMIVPTAAGSAFLNNTPVVAMLIPEVRAWAEKREQSPSLFLMPLSFAALLGGVITLIGTSTNVVISELLETEGAEPFGFFELSMIGIPVAIGGTILLVVLAPRLLPARKSGRRDLQEARDFVVDMTVQAGGQLDGKEVGDGGLRHLRSVFLAAVERDGNLVAPVTPKTALRGGDRLRFVGRTDDVMELQGIKGLASTERPHLLDMDTERARYFEVVIGPQSRLVGKTLAEAGFRERYQAVVMAIHRAGQRIEAKLGQVPLRVGDTLLVLADPGFRERWRDRADFLMISGGLGALPVRTGKSLVVGAIALALIVSTATGLLPILQASLIGALLLVFSGVLTTGEARSAVDLDVILVIAFAFGLAAAMESSGLAGLASEWMVAPFRGLGDVGVMIGIVLATVILTALITNNAAALLMFPIAVSAAATTGVDLRPLAVAITVAASVDFLTPIGYQTNTMVYGPGGYRFFDYTRLGAPLTLFVLACIVFVVPRVWPL